MSRTCQGVMPIALVCFVLLLPSNDLLGQARSEPTLESKPWKLWRENTTLNVSYRRVPNSKRIEIYTQAQIKSSLSAFLLFLQDYENIPNWLDRAETSRLLEQITPQENIFTTQFSGMWFVSPRVMTIRTRYWQNDDGGIDIQVWDATDQAPPQAGYIAISVIKARWKIQSLDEEKILIRYTFIADANGNVPYWLANNIALQSIWRTLSNIERQLPNSVWQQQTLDGINEYSGIPSN